MNLEDLIKAQEKHRIKQLKQQLKVLVIIKKNRALPKITNNMYEDLMNINYDDKEICDI